MNINDARAGRDLGPRILVIQTAFLGDVLLSTPVLFRLRERFPDARIDYLTAPRGAEVLETNPCLDATLTYDKYGKDRGPGGFLKQVRVLRKTGYTGAVVIHRSLRSALLAYFAGIPVRVGFSNSAGAALFSHRAEYRNDLHEIERDISLLHAIGIHAAGMPPQVFTTAEDDDAARRFYLARGIDTGAGLIGAAPGSAWATKRWPASHYAGLLGRLSAESGQKIILFGGRDDILLCKRIEEDSGGGVYSSAGSFTPRQSVAAMKALNILIANDNGAVHLGLAAGIRVAAIFGPTVPEFGFAPYGEGHRIIGIELDCRPCGRHGANSCPLGHFRCMKELSVETVYSAVLPMLTGT